MVPIDPDAPWGWNLAILALFIISSMVTTWIVNRSTKVKLASMQEDMTANRSQLENEHVDSDYPNLRDELTAIRGGVGEVRSELRDLRKDVTGIRADARNDRRETAENRKAIDDHLEAVPRLFAETVAKATAAHVQNCPHTGKT